MPCDLLKYYVQFSKKEDLKFFLMNTATECQKLLRKHVKAYLHDNKY